jgi:hypothetical protein
MNVRRKILLVSNGFYPEISPRSYRATELTKEFSRQGHDVTVISKYRDHDYSLFLSEFPVKFKMWRKPWLPKIPQLKNASFAFLTRGISRILSVFFEYPVIEEMFNVKRMLRYEYDYDLMVSFAVPYPVHWGVAWARTGKHKIAYKWIADCGDPYMGDVLDSFRKPFYFGYLEKYFCRKADFISIPIESARHGYYSEFQTKIKIIPQGFDFPLNNGAAEEPSNNVPTFAYAGGFLAGARDPGPLLQFLGKLNFPFKFLVFTNMPEFLDQYKELLQGKLFISDYIPRGDLMKVLARMDFLINFDNNTTLNSPSKLIDYAIARRPVLNIRKDFSTNDVALFLEGNYSRRMVLPDPEHYHIQNISILFLDLLISE